MFMIKSKGFTLIELLVVIVLISILASLVIPNYRKAVLKSLFEDAKTKLILIRAANRMYYLDNKTYATGKIDASHTLVTEKYIDVLCPSSSDKVSRRPYDFYAVNVSSITIGQAQLRGGADTKLPDPITIDIDGNINPSDLSL